MNYIYKTYSSPGRNTTEIQHFFYPFTFLMIISVICNINKSEDRGMCEYVFA